MKAAGRETRMMSITNIDSRHEAVVSLSMRRNGRHRRKSLVQYRLRPMVYLEGIDFVDERGEIGESSILSCFINCDIDAMMVTASRAQRNDSVF